MVVHALWQLVSKSSHRLALPIAVYPGAALTGASIRAVVTDPQVQVGAARALHERFQTPAVLSAMDLSVEAEAFGREIQLSDHEVPTVIGPRITSIASAQALAVPAPGAARTWVYLETVRQLAQLAARPLVLAGCIGPFSLAGRLAGMSEICELTLTEPQLVRLLLEKSTAFLISYIQAFQKAGADGVIMAEPAAGLLSPRSLAVFSSAYVRRIVEATEDGRFCVILHNCAARLAHLPAILESGATALHFGTPMDMVSALVRIPSGVVVCGNLDPIGVFVQSSADELARAARALLDATAAHSNFVISSGCDVPRAAPLANLEAFFRTVSET